MNRWIWLVQYPLFHNLLSFFPSSFYLRNEYIEALKQIHFLPNNYHQHHEQYNTYANEDSVVKAILTAGIPKSFIMTQLGLYPNIVYLQRPKARYQISFSYDSSWWVFLDLCTILCLVRFERMIVFKSCVIILSRMISSLTILLLMIIIVTRLECSFILPPSSSLRLNSLIHSWFIYPLWSKEEIWRSLIAVPYHCQYLQALYSWYLQYQHLCPDLVWWQFIHWCISRLAVFQVVVRKATAVHR